MCPAVFELSVERANPGEEVHGSIPAAAARSVSVTSNCQTPVL